MFHGRVHQGVMEAGGVAFDAPDHTDTHDAKGIGYVRPHDLEVDRHAPGAEGIVVRLRRVHAIGPLAQLELERDDNAEMIEAVISNERFARLKLKEGETLIVRPRRLHVFVDPAPIIEPYPARTSS
jgi:sulfate transport system ATP-binding protein